MLLTVVSRTLIGQTVLGHSSRMCLVGVTMNAFTTMSTTVSSVAGRAWLMSCVAINTVLQDTILVHG